jgi:hypothetical protein
MISFLKLNLIMDKIKQLFIENNFHLIVYNNNEIYIHYKTNYLFNDNRINQILIFLRQDEIISNVYQVDIDLFILTNMKRLFYVTLSVLDINNFPHHNNFDFYYINNEHSNEDNNEHSNEDSYEIRVEEVSDADDSVSINSDKEIDLQDSRCNVERQFDIDDIDMTDREPYNMTYEDFYNKYNYLLFQEYHYYEKNKTTSDFLPCFVRDMIENSEPNYLFDYLLQNVSKSGSIITTVIEPFIKKIHTVYLNSTISKTNRQIQMNYVMDNVSEFILMEFNCTCCESYCFVANNRIYTDSKCFFKCMYKRYNYYLYEMQLPFDIDHIMFKNNIFMIKSKDFIYFIVPDENIHYFTTININNNTKHDISDYDLYFDPTNKCIIGTNKLNTNRIKIDGGSTMQVLNLDQNKYYYFTNSFNNLIELRLVPNGKYRHKISCKSMMYSDKIISQHRFDLEHIFYKQIISKEKIKFIYESYGNEFKNNQYMILFIIIESNDVKLDSEMIPCVVYDPENYVVIKYNIWNFYFVKNLSQSNMFLLLCMNDIIYLICNKELTFSEAFIPIQWHYFSNKIKTYVFQGWYIYVVSHQCNQIKHMSCTNNSFAISDGNNVYIYQNFLNKSFNITKVDNDNYSSLVDREYNEINENDYEIVSIIVSKSKSALEQMFTILETHLPTVIFDYNYYSEDTQIAYGNGVANDFWQRVWSEFKLDYLSFEESDIYPVFKINNISKLSEYQLRLIGRAIYHTLINKMKIPYRLPLDLIAIFSSIYPNITNSNTNNCDWDISEMELEYFMSVNNKTLLNSIKQYKKNNKALMELNTGHQDYVMLLKSLLPFSHVRNICEEIYFGFRQISKTSIAKKGLLMPTIDFLFSGPIGFIDKHEIINCVKFINDLNPDTNVTYCESIIKDLFEVFIMELNNDQINTLLLNWTGCTNPILDVLIIRIFDDENKYDYCDCRISTCEKSISVHYMLLAPTNLPMLKEILTNSVDNYLQDK